MSLAPIVLFTYNRLYHTQQTIEALKKNDLANESELIIYSDGWKNENDKQKVQEVRNYIKTIQGFKTTTIIEQSYNKGLADSIINGVTKIVNQYGKIIVLEDDIVTSPYFLKFMNEALNFYENEEKVWHISGWSFPAFDKSSNQTFLWRVMNCWGWATWNNRWQYFKKDINKIKDTYDIYKINRFNLDGYFDFWTQIEDNYLGKKNTWAVFWYETIFKNNGLCLNPEYPLIYNIGTDKLSSNTKKRTEQMQHSINTNKSYILPTNIIEDKNRVYKIQKYLSKINKGFNVNKRFSDEDYKLLVDTPRFQDVEIKFFNTPIKAPDSASLLFLNRELFGQEIYMFEANNDTPFIIDAGANIGLSIIYFKMLYPKAKIIAFEPDKKIFEYLKYNINSFGFDDVQLINKGLWDSKTTLRFFSEGSDGGRIAVDTDNENIVEIETTLLSEYIKDKQVDFLKIDIEGAETRVLKEIKKYIGNIENIFIEYHSFATEKQTLSTILQILEENNFRYYIDRMGVKSQQPFMKINTSLNFDNQLNISGYRQ